MSLDSKFLVELLVDPRYLLLRAVVFIIIIILFIIIIIYYGNSIRVVDLYTMRIRVIVGVLGLIVVGIVLFYPGSPYAQADTKGEAMVNSTSPMNTLEEEAPSVFWLFFKNRAHFDKWHEDVNLKLGYPKYGRNAASGKINYKSGITKQYTKCVESSIKDNKKVVCVVKKKSLPCNFYAQKAQDRYGFRVVKDRTALNEMGFYNNFEEM